MAIKTKRFINNVKIAAVVCRESGVQLLIVMVQ